MLHTIAILSYTFGRRCIGIILRPYETYRTIVDHGRLGELLFVGIIISIYFAFASVVKQSLFHPFLLTRQFIVLVSAAAASYLLTVWLFWLVSKLFGRSGTFRGFSIAWGYTFVPTSCWFTVTSLLYIILPPPRTTSIAGISFSILFLLFSATLLFWKIILSYLALRFGLRMTLGKILGTSAIVLPVLGLYSVAMYRLGIFRIPFI